MKFCTEHGSDTVMLCVKFQNYLKGEINVMDKDVLMISGLRLNYSEMSFINTTSQYPTHSDLYVF